MPARNATTSSRCWCAEATRRSARRATARTFSVGCRCLLPTPMVIRAELRPRQSAPAGAAVIRAVRDRVRSIETTRGLKPALYESGNRVPNPESRIPNPESRVPNPESRVPSPESGAPSQSLAAVSASWPERGEVDSLVAGLVVDEAARLHLLPGVRFGFEGRHTNQSKCSRA
jgi:hypothetical protein